MYGLIGDPIDHSVSPTIQNAAFRSARLDAVYLAFPVGKSRLKSAILGLKALGIRGFNVTTPHKTAMLRYLEKVDTKAAEIGSINTVKNDSGSLIGFNTDGSGAITAMQRAGLSLNGQAMLLLGAGGAARAIAYSMGGSGCSVTLMSRTASHAKLLAKSLRIRFGTKAESVPLSRKSLRECVSQADIILNASSMGMDAKNNPPIDRSWIRSDHWVFDIVYRPVQTKLLQIAKARGARTINGLEMLLNQGASSFTIWTGRNAPTVAMRRAMIEKLRVQNAGNS